MQLLQGRWLSHLDLLARHQSQARETCFRRGFTPAPVPAEAGLFRGEEVFMRDLRLYADTSDLIQVKRSHRQSDHDWIAPVA
jgi:hypothetical protein